MSSGDGLKIEVIFWVGELRCYKFCIRELGVFFLCVRSIACAIFAYVFKMLAIDVDEAANRKQSRENVGHN